MRLREIKDNPSRKACFGILNDERNRLAVEGLTEEDFWDYIRSYYKIKSRTELGRVGWTDLANHLSIAQRNPKKWDNLIRKVWRFKYAS